MIYDSQEWREKMDYARSFAGRHNTRVAVVAQRWTYAGKQGWHYIVVRARHAHYVRVGQGR